MFIVSSALTEITGAAFEKTAPAFLKIFFKSPVQSGEYRASREA
jgi:hypothetical protein